MTRKPRGEFCIPCCQGLKSRAYMAGTSLSVYLLQCIKNFDEIANEELSREQYEDLRSMVDLMARALLESKLAVTDQLAVREVQTTLHLTHEYIEDLFDDYYTRDLLKNVPKFARRTTKLESLIVTRLPSDEVRVYVREADRNYVFGFWRSCIILARVALETALRERLKTKGETPRDL